MTRLDGLKIVAQVKFSKSPINTTVLKVPIYTRCRLPSFSVKSRRAFFLHTHTISYFTNKSYKMPAIEHPTIKGMLLIASIALNLIS
jgi:hypothetical protein